MLWLAAKNILRYLEETLDFGIYYLIKDKREFFLPMLMETKQVIQIYINQS